MWERIRRELLVEYYWWKRHKVKKHYGDSSLGVMGILLIITGIILMIIVGQAFAAFFRNIIPLVSGSQVAGTYWSSFFLALKASVVFMVFLVSLVFILFHRFSGRRK